MKNKIDVQDLTEEQTKALALECLSMLDLLGRIEIVRSAFEDTDEREELVAQLEG